MEYFYILCSAASLAAFLAYILERLSWVKVSYQLHAVVSVFVISTAIFWLWFYFEPENPVREKIAQRSIFVTSYTDGGKKVDVVEGEFEVDTLTWSNRILLPPFSAPPEVTVFPVGRRDAGVPRIEEVTEDMFVVTIDGSTMAGTWGFRARGELLRRIEE